MYRFVDRDIFMWFCGGRIGHKATHNWDKFLQLEGHGHDEASDDSDLEEDMEDDSNLEVDDIRLEEGQDGKGDEDEEEEADNNNDKDRVIADDGEEVYSDVLAAEGYGAL
jgi:hypothetical protein